MVARYSSSKTPKKPPLTTTRFRRMFQDCVRLYNKYQGDLDEVFPFALFNIANAQQRVDMMSHSPKAGAPKFWTDKQLGRLWVLVRARQIAKPALTVRDICRELAQAGSWRIDESGNKIPAKGYAVWAEENRSIKGEEVSQHITNAEQLRRRYADADRKMGLAPGIRERFEEEAQHIADLRLQVSQSTPSPRRGR
jgi:hypothetical protein